MEPNKKEYTLPNGNAYKYVGVVDDPNKDYSFNNEYVDNLIDNRKYEEALDYYNNYIFSNQKDINAAQDHINKIKTALREKQYLEGKMSADQEDAVNFINDLNTTAVYNNRGYYGTKFNEIKEEIFGDNDYIDIRFAPEKQKLFGIDWLDFAVKDNTENNIKSFKQRLNERLKDKLGIDNPSYNYLQQYGIEFHEGDNYVRVNKNSDYLYDLLISAGEYKGWDYGVTYNQVDNSGKELDLITKDKSIVRLRQFNDLYKEALDKNNKVYDNIDESVYRPYYYSLETVVSMDYKSRIDKGGTDGSAASKMLDMYNTALKAALISYVPGTYEMEIYQGDGYAQLDDNGLAVMADDEHQKKVKELIDYAITSNNLNSDNLVFNLAVTPTGRVGMNFQISAYPGDKNRNSNEHVSFTIWDWNTDIFQNLINSSTEFQATKELYEIAAFNSYYESKNGDVYRHAGGEGPDAVFTDKNGRLVDFNYVRNEIQKDKAIDRDVKGIVSSNYSRMGTPINEDVIDAQALASAISISNEVNKQVPTYTNGEAIPLATVANLIKGIYNSTTNQQNSELYSDLLNYGINSDSYDLLKDIYNNYININQQLSMYNYK